MMTPYPILRELLGENYWRPAVGYTYETNTEGTTLKQLAPGLDIEQISLRFQDHKLSLTVEPTEEQKEAWKSTGVEQLFGTYTYAIPHEVDASKIKAKLAKGILEVFLPTGKTSKPIKIEVS